MKKAEEWAKDDMFRNLKYRPEKIANLIRDIQNDAQSSPLPSAMKNKINLDDVWDMTDEQLDAVLEDAGIDADATFEQVLLSVQDHGQPQPPKAVVVALLEKDFRRNRHKLRQSFRQVAE